MKIIDQSWAWIQKPTSPLQTIERAGRVCYKSEDRITKDSAVKFVEHLVSLKHEAVLEHAVASVLFTTNRGVTHELVRHRLCSFCQESTRYVKYQDVEFIKPVWWDDEHYTEEQKNVWKEAMQNAERSYQLAIQAHDKPEQAREILPNSVKTEIIVTANLREWRHIFELRCSSRAHPQIRALMQSCLKGFAAEIPVVFDDININYGTDA